MADEARPQRPCDQCGQTDDHPRHFMPNGDIVHYDCIPANHRAKIAETDDSDRLVEVIDKCVDGLRGPKLLAFIEKGK